MTRVRLDWIIQLPKVEAMRKSGRGWKEIAFDLGVSVSALHKARKKWKDAILEPVREDPKTPEAPPTVEPELVRDEEGRLVKRYPPRWADEAGVGRYTVKPKSRHKRDDS